MDKAITPIVPKSAQTYDRFLSKLQQFSTDSLGPLLYFLGQTKKGKLTVKDLAAPLEVAIMLVGNAAAHLSVERSKSLMKYLNRDLKPMEEGHFPGRGPLLFGEDLLAGQQYTANNVKAPKGFMQKRPQQGFSGSSDQGIFLPAPRLPPSLGHPSTFPLPKILGVQPVGPSSPPTSLKPEASPPGQEVSPHQGTVGHVTPMVQPLPLSSHPDWVQAVMRPQDFPVGMSLLIADWVWLF